MNSRQAHRLGVESGLEAGRFGDFSSTERADVNSFTAACAEVCENKRQYAGHAGYDFNPEPNADRLWDAFENGEAVGIRQAWRERGRRRRERLGLPARTG
jgi:hypothetical protein